MWGEAVAVCVCVFGLFQICADGLCVVVLCVVYVVLAGLSSTPKKPRYVFVCDIRSM